MTNFYLLSASLQYLQKVIAILRFKNFGDLTRFQPESHTRELFYEGSPVSKGHFSAFRCRTRVLRVKTGHRAEILPGDDVLAKLLGPVIERLFFLVGKIGRAHV